jgi:hypothetical protein
MDTLPYPSRPTNKQTILNVFRVRVCVSVCVCECVCVCVCVCVFGISKARKSLLT